MRYESTIRRRIRDAFMNRTHNTRRPSLEGFTIVEMLVAVAIFSVVVLVAVTALLSVIDANKKARALQTVMNNIHLALESFSREVRTGKHYHCGTLTSIETPLNCPSGASLMVFEAVGGDDEDAGDQHIYRFNAGAIERSTDGGSSFNAVTADNVTIDDFTVYVYGAESDDTEQPHIVMSLAGTVGSGAFETDFNIQTSVTQRLLDL